MNPPGRSVLLAVAILGFALALRVAGLDKSLWVDEVGSHEIATSADFLARSRGDVHPPLYYGLLRLGTKLTGSDAVLRGFSVLCGLLTVGLMLRLPARGAAGIAALLVACTPGMIGNSQGLRQYALLGLLLTAALLATLNLLDHPDSKPARGWLLATSVLAASTHLVSGFFLLALGAVLLLFPGDRTPRQRMAGAELLVPAALLLLFFRYVYLTRTTALTADWWAGPFSLGAFSSQFAAAAGAEALAWLAAAVGRHLAGGEILSLSLAVVGGGLMAWAAWDHRDRRALAALLIALLYWAFLAVYSCLSVNLGVARLILPGMLPLIASLTLGLASQPRPRLRQGAMATAVLLALTATIPWWRHFAWQPLEDLRGLAATLRRVHQPGDVLVLVGNAQALRYYWPGCDEETKPLKVDPAEPWTRVLENLAQALTARAPAAVTVVYRREGGREPGIWRVIEAQLHHTGRNEEPVWDRDYYNIVRFPPPLR